MGRTIVSFLSEACLKAALESQVQSFRFLELFFPAGRQHM